MTTASTNPVCPECFEPVRPGQRRHPESGGVVHADCATVIDEDSMQACDDCGLRTTNATVLDVCPRCGSPDTHRESLDHRVPDAETKTRRVYEACTTEWERCGEIAERSGLRSEETGGPLGALAKRGLLETRGPDGWPEYRLADDAPRVS